MNLLKLKKRPLHKGLILIASDYKQFLPYLKKDEISNKHLKIMFSYWPGPFSFIVPASHNTPKWLTGNFNSIAIRVTNHLIAKKLCKKFGKPIVSTSANISGLLPCRTVEEVKFQFGKKIFILFGKINNKCKPSEIRDILTGKLIRKG